MCTLDLQNKKGEQAQAPASDGWIKKILPGIKRAAEEKLGEHGVQPHEIMYQFDNATHHTSDMEKVHKLVKPSQIVPQPKQGPDFQRIVENVHGSLVSALGRYLAMHPKIQTIKGYKKAAMGLFYGNVKTTTGGTLVTAEGVKREMAKVDQFYEEVVREKGGWPSIAQLQ